MFVDSAKLLAKIRRNKHFLNGEWIFISGRKTRGKVGKGNEKAKLDKEWNQISALLDKRKGGGGGGSEAKRPKFD